MVNMLNTEEIILKLSEAAVHVYLDNGVLKTRSIKNTMSAELINLIRSNKERLIEYLAASDADNLTQGKKRSKIKPVLRDSTPIPLSFAQERLWFINRLEGESCLYNIPTTIPINGEFNIDAAEQAFNRIVQRHEALRTVFEEQENGPVQIIQENVTFKLTRYDLTALDKKKQAVRVKQLITQEHKKVFDLSCDLMLRGVYIQLSNYENNPEGVLLFTMHHIASDGWSMGIVSTEFTAQYQAILEGRNNPLAALEIQYADYAHWQRQWLAGDVLQNQFAYWDKQLAEVPAVHSLALDFARPAMKSTIGAVVSEALSAQLCQQLITVARNYKVTPFMLLHAALALVLSRHSNNSDSVIGTPVANRMQTELETLIGFFVNTLVLRSNTDHKYFNDYLNHIKDVNLGAQANQDVPFESLVERCKLPRSTQYTPLFQIMFSMDTNEGAERDNSITHIPGVHFSADVIAEFDLSLDAELDEAGGYLWWVYDTSLFSQAHIESLNAHFQRLLTGIAKNPESPINDLPMLLDKDIHYLLHELNNKQTDYPKNLLIHQLFEQQVEKTPVAVAVVFADKQLSYQQLNKKSNQLAHYLINKKHVKPNTLVGICFERSLDMIVGVLGILKAGAAYVPLDPNYPEARLAFMLEDANLETVITQTHLLEQSPISEQQAVCIDDKTLVDRLNRQTSTNINPEQLGLFSHHLAYIIYTSGSTGNPKGVQVTHRNVHSYYLAVQEHYRIEPTDKVMQFSSISFDIFVEEMHITLLTGATLVLRNHEILLGGSTFWSFIQQYQISVVSLPTAFWHQLCKQINKNTPPNSAGLRLMITGGEVMSQVCLKRWTSSMDKHIVLLNSYGPTEATIIASVYDARRYQSSFYGVPIGVPISSAACYVVDDKKQLCPMGVHGELYIGGDSVAAGYLNQPELSAEEFIKNPFLSETSERCYKTGDLVRWSPDGNLEFIGRVDNQVKIRGFRIELGEIELQLSQCEGVSSAVVLVREDKPGEKHLVAYVVAKQTHEPMLNKEAVICIYRDYLNSRLPTYMVPSVFLLLKVLPLTANGKVDRDALPIPNEGDYQTTHYIAPKNNIEAWLCEIWQDIFGLEKVGINDNFFDLGGHSLLSVKLASRVNKKFDINLPLFHYFKNQTIQSFAKLLINNEKHKYESLVRMNADGDKHSVLMIPGMGGSSHIFYELSTFITKQHPVYGLDAIGVNGDIEPHDSIEAIAKYNIDCLLQTTLRPPFILIGHSLGACVAFEMAKQLELKTNKTSILIVIDGSPFLQGLTNVEIEQYKEMSTTELSFSNFEEKQACISYKPTDITVESIVVIQAQENNGQLNNEWQQYSRNTIEHHYVSGDHFSLLKRPQASVVGNIINVSIE